MRTPSIATASLIGIIAFVVALIVLPNNTGFSWETQTDYFIALKDWKSAAMISGAVWTLALVLTEGVMVPKMSFPQKSARFKSIPWRPVLITIGVILFLAFVWPGIYIYGHYQGGAVRTNRFTGVRQEATYEGWR